jgi:choline transport protein
MPHLPIRRSRVTDIWSIIRSLGAGLINGGFGGLFWTFIGTVTCYATIVASLAEMESM